MGLAGRLREHGIPVTVVPKVSSGDAAILDLIEAGRISLVINTPLGKKSIDDEKAIRLAANRMRIPTVTTMPGFNALVFGLGSLNGKEWRVASLQDYISKREQVA